MEILSVCIITNLIIISNRRKRYEQQTARLSGKPCQQYRSDLSDWKSTPEIIEALDAALEKRELIKVSVLKNCIDDPKEIASVIAERTHSNVVKVIGKKMIFYRKAKKNPKIKLPE